MILNNAEGNEMSLQASGGFLITPSDSEVIKDANSKNVISKGIRISNGGPGKNITFVYVNGEQETFFDVENGYHPIIIKQVKFTGTTANLKIHALR